MIPLSELGSANYFGFAGGLYPDGENSPPAAYREVGIALGRAVESLDKAGNPATSGKVGILCVGMSNASRDFKHFIRLAGTSARQNPNLVMIDGAQNGADATKIADAVSDYWVHVNRQLERSEATSEQIQVVWLKAALAYQPRDFPEHARRLQKELRSIVEVLRMKFAQLKLVYVSSRTYGGYSTTDLSPEPTAYESGFAVKWMIEDLIRNPGPENARPWVSWGPYLWADGNRPRSDGLTWERSDFEPDGVHPSLEGARKVASKLLEFFETNPTAQPWFISRPQ